VMLWQSSSPNGIQRQQRYVVCKFVAMVDGGIMPTNFQCMEKFAGDLERLQLQWYLAAWHVAHFAA
jgi:hypothetical protein